MANIIYDFEGDGFWMAEEVAVDHTHPVCRLDGSLHEKINDDVRRCILSNSSAVSCAIDDFPMPACPKRTRPRSESEFGSFTQLVIKSRNATRVPARQPLSGLNRELTARGISLIIASSSMTTIGSAT